MTKNDKIVEMGEYIVKDYVYFANPTSYFDVTVGAASFNEQLNLAICYKENTIKEEVIKEYTRDVVELWCS